MVSVKTKISTGVLLRFRWVQSGLCCFYGYHAVVIYGYQWSYMVISGHIWLSVVIHGFQ